MVDQHFRSSERGKAGMFCLQQVLLDFVFFPARSRGSVRIRAGLECFIKSGPYQQAELQQRG